MLKLKPQCSLPLALQPSGHTTTLQTGGGPGAPHLQLQRKGTREGGRLSVRGRTTRSSRLPAAHRDPCFHKMSISASEECSPSEHRLIKAFVKQQELASLPLQSAFYLPRASDMSWMSKVLFTPTWSRRLLRKLFRV